MKKNQKSVVFSCVGTSDPIRGEHDGPLLHTLRHYKPEAVFVMVTPEVEELNKHDKRAPLTESYLKEKWDGYSPEVSYYRCHELKDVSDIDLIDRYVRSAFAECQRKYPDSKIIINTSSGTPQMKTILSHLAIDSKYDTIAVQVKNYEHSSGTSTRTNDKNYDVSLQLEFNEDDQPDAACRCVEPELYAIRRRNSAERVRALLKKRDFPALSDIKEEIPERLHPLIDHLSERSQLNWKEATKHSKAVNLDFELYPENKDSPFPSAVRQTDYKQIAEYALLMKNLQKSGKLSEFILRLEPLVRNLQMSLLDDLLMKHYGITFTDIAPDKRKYNPEQFQTAAKELYDKVTLEFGKELEEKDVSTSINNSILSCFEDIPEKSKELFSIYDNLRYARNELAHQLFVVSDNDIKRRTGKTSGEIEKIIEQSIKEIFPQCNPSIFNVYDKCISYISDNL